MIYQDKIISDTGCALEAKWDGRLMFAYIYHPDTPESESPRPYFHPLFSRSGDLLTNFRPHDHPWHHGLSLAIARIGTTNFWGGPTYDREMGYGWQSNHGRQRHLRFKQINADAFDEDLVWEDPSRRPLMSERRQISFTKFGRGWLLEWKSTLENISAFPFTVSNYESDGGLAGSFYGGLQFRGARDLLAGACDQDMRAEGGYVGESAIHGQNAGWMEWRCHHDGSLRRTRLRFESKNPVWLFVRRRNPLTTLGLQRGAPLVVSPGGKMDADFQISARQEE